MLTLKNSEISKLETDSQKSGPSKIYIFTSESFPRGLAATNRIISYARGFLNQAVQIEVICFRKTENKENVVNIQIKDSFRSIPFHYLSKTTIKSGSFIKRRIDNTVINIRLLIFSVRYLNNSSFSIYYSSLTSTAIILRIASWLKGSKLFKEESEHPSVYLKFKSAPCIYLYSKIHYSLFDGLFLMTNNLIYYFKEKIHYGKPVLHVPMTVDIERFQSQDIKRKKTIAYCGMLNDEKDGTNILIQAFAEICRIYPDYSLSLYGITEKKGELQKYNQLVLQLDITENVFFHGKIPNDKIPALLMEASILVLPRPHSIQAEHGFPTKLGEYLATGNPVIVTPVGDIPLYLKDKVDAYFAEPGNAESLAEKCIELIKNKTIADSIGRKGKAVALKYFNNINQTKNIIKFYNDSINKN